MVYVFFSSAKPTSKNLPPVQQGPLQYPGAVGVSNALLQATTALAGPQHTPQLLAKDGKHKGTTHTIQEGALS